MSHQAHTRCLAQAISQQTLAGAQDPETTHVAVEFINDNPGRKVSWGFQRAEVMHICRSIYIYAMLSIVCLITLCSLPWLLKAES